MIVVTGGTGLVGGHLLLKLAEDENPVRVLIRPGSNPRKVFAVWQHYSSDLEKLFARFDWVEADLWNRDDLYEALKESDYIYHCAAKVSFDNKDRKEMWLTNVVLTQMIVDFCLAQKHTKLAYISSVASIAKGNNGEPTSEQDGWPVHPKSMYSKTKTLAEFEVWRGIAEGLNAVIVNPSVILGPGNWETSSARIVKVIDNGLKYYTGGSTGFVDVTDVVEILIRLMKSSITGERFLINAVNLSYKDLFCKLSEELRVKPPSKNISPFITSIIWKIEWLMSLLGGKKARITRESANAAHSTQIYSANKVQEKLGYKFRSIEDTIHDVVSCYRKY